MSKDDQQSNTPESDSETQRVWDRMPHASPEQMARTMFHRAEKLERELAEERTKNEQKILKAMEFGAQSERRVHSESTRPAWIPIGERLPDEGAIVLVWEPKLQNVWEAYVRHGHWHFAQTHVQNLQHITHWMQLPEAPKP